MGKEKSLTRLVQSMKEHLNECMDELKACKDKGALITCACATPDENKYPDDASCMPLTRRFVMAVDAKIRQFACSKMLPLKVAFLGPAGTFTHSALLNCFGDTVEQVPLKTIPDVFREVETGGADLGLVPVENSTEGAVTYTLDELIDTELTIVAEHYLRVRYCLVSKEHDMEMIKKVYSHPQSLAQCKGWLREHLSGVQTIPVESTSRAAEMCLSEKGSGALASEIAGEMYNLNIIATGLEDLKQNYTRFFVVGRDFNAPAGNDKTSIVCSITDKPAALSELLVPFAASGINMTKIESRPDKKKAWEYNFYIDFEGHRDDSHVRKAIESMKKSTVFLKVLGSYPAGKKI